ncbi:hypothetical protein GCM10010129_80100 [Streptomyces fumigatiscleroticus]|nr:hypothetical protein GCM10010129_80100 [Streptomyces fumigatiscleroticus]
MARARTRAVAPSSADGGRTTGSRIAVAVAVLAVVAGGVCGGTALKRHGDARHAGPAGAPSAQTTLIRRTDLSDSQELPGTLGYGAPVTVKGAGKGLITALPASGSTVTRGETLYRVDDQPVMVFYGDTPVFRTLDKARGPAADRGTGSTASAGLAAAGRTAAGRTAEGRTADGAAGLAPEEGR